MDVDFGKTAVDYGRYRTGFPEEMFVRLGALGVGASGERVVDLGTGTGVLARGFAGRGCLVTGVDVASELIEQGRAQGDAAGLEVEYRVAPAEDTGLAAGEWDLVSAGQCWHWFDRPKVAGEARRLLVDDGALLICYRDYHVAPGNVCAVSEELVLAYNPGWPMAGGDTSRPRAQWLAELAEAGFGRQESFSFETTVSFTHEAWRGRMRSSNGVGASLSPADVAAFDAELARVLRERFPHEPLMVPHTIWGLVVRSTS